MLNSKDKIVQVLKDHFNGLGIGIELNNKKLVIRDNLLNVTIVTHVIVALLVIKYTSTLQGSLYLSPILALYALLAYVILWVDYKSINIIEFDLLNKNMSVTNRSFVRRLILKYVVPQPTTYYFREIGAIAMTDNETKTMLQTKHFVNVNMKNGESIALISFSDKMNSVLFSEFITALMD